MPELPEIEARAKWLRRWMSGHRIVKVVPPDNVRQRARLSPAEFVHRVRGHTVQSVHRKGKWILLKLSGGGLWIHLGMTGDLERDKRAQGTCLLATAFYFKIVEKIEEEGKADARFKRMKRFRYHALSLAGIYWEKGNDRKAMDELIKDTTIFEKNFRTFWFDVRRILIDAIVALEEQGIPLNSYIRNVDKWETMGKKFSMYTTKSA